MLATSTGVLYTTLAGIAMLGVHYCWTTKGKYHEKGREPCKWLIHTVLHCSILYLFPFHILLVKLYTWTLTSTSAGIPSVLNSTLALIADIVNSDPIDQHTNIYAGKWKIIYYIIKDQSVEDSNSVYTIIMNAWYESPDGKLHAQSETLNACIGSKTDPSIGEILKVTLGIHSNRFWVFSCNKRELMEKGSVIAGLVNEVFNM